MDVAVSKRGKGAGENLLAMPEIQFHRVAAALTDQERTYCLKVVELGCRKKALAALGFKTMKPETFEGRKPEIVMYLAELQAAASVAAGITSSRVVRRLDRIAETAEQRGKLGIAVLANKTLGQAIGMFQPKDNGSIRINGDGNTINIVAGTPSVVAGDDGEIIDAEYREILALNGRD